VSECHAGLAFIYPFGIVAAFVVAFALVLAFLACHPRGGSAVAVAVGVAGPIGVVFSCHPSPQAEDILLR
jgi:hypothetical protein